uniref:Oligopeptidase A N-terminal domain-containing protein n=1 Tax=Triticum urartu TaxID=4572 RepID=A0A8R7TUB3_TRIUA
MENADRSSNPLLADYDFPSFDRVEPAHIRPGIHALLVLREGKLEELEKGVAPVWECLVHPLERSIDRLDIVWNIVDHIKAVKDSPDLRAVVEDVQVVSSSVTPPVIGMDEAVDFLAHHEMLSQCLVLIHELSSNMVHRQKLLIDPGFVLAPLVRMVFVGMWYRTRA